MRIMISHEHRETGLAKAWKEMLDGIGGEKISTWFSSDTRPDGGVPTGEWWSLLNKEIEKSEYIIAILTKSSIDRPWIIWECGLAKAQTNTKGIIPICYGFSQSELTGPLGSFQSYRGDDSVAITRLLEILGSEVNVKEVNLDIHVEKYLGAVQDFYNMEPMINLFGTGFHKRDNSLEGKWECEWYDAEGNLFVSDTITIYMFDNSVRVVGETKEGLYYPMEGKISPERYMSLHYWSEGQVAKTGVALVKISPAGTKLRGQWMGHTAEPGMDEELFLVSGKVICTKIS